MSIFRKAIVYLPLLVLALTCEVALSEMSDEEATAGLRDMARQLSFLKTAEFNEMGLRVKDITVEEPRTMIWLYEFKGELAGDDSVVAKWREQTLPLFKKLLEQAHCNNPATAFWRENQLYTRWVYRDQSGSILAEVSSEGIECPSR